MEMNIRDYRHVGAFADLIHCGRGIIIRHGDSDDLAPSLDHLIDLSQRSVNIGRVSLGHRLHDDRRSATDLYIAYLYRSRNSHKKFSKLQS